MLKDIAAIKLSGANFDSSATFNFFNFHNDANSKTIKGVLLYGRNGTGKTTIARAFRKISGIDIPTIASASLYDSENNLISLTEHEKQHIFVFDEDYINKNIRLQQDHLETIVMLGPAANLAEELELAENELNNIKAYYEEKEREYKEHLDPNNNKSPQYWINRLAESLRGDNNWAGRDRKIKNSRHNTPVTDDTYKKFVNIIPSKPYDELVCEFDKLLEKFEDIRADAITIEANIPVIPNSYATYNDDEVVQLLAQKIEKPELSEREKKLFSLVQDGKTDDLFGRLEKFKNPAIIECPYCFQAMTPTYRESLIENLEKVLNKSVKIHRDDLEKHITKKKLGDILDITAYEKLIEHQKCVNLISKIDNMLQENNEYLNKKHNNPYDPITITSSIKPLIVQLHIALDNLEKAKDKYNDIVKNNRIMVAELDRINSEIAHYDIEEPLKILKKQTEEANNINGSFEESKLLYLDKQKEINTLRAKRNSVHIAIDKINTYFKYIFFAENRLEIKYANDKYKLLSHGKDVRPCDVSAGERNIIGLSYFFIDILRNKEETSAYNEEYLIVIDDPISSYDTENRIGILSFLNYKLSMFLEGNQNTKALVMTHDLVTFDNLSKILDNIIYICKQKGYPLPPKYNQLELLPENSHSLENNQFLKKFDTKKRHEYTEILKTIYLYASTDTTEYEFVIGNMIRQALEAFATFEYRKNIYITADTQILKLLRDPKYCPYYKNLMHQLVLHGSSHREEQIKTMNDLLLFSSITKEQKIRIAKDLLCFIYLLNKAHLLSHLGNCENVETNLESWCNDIKKNSIE